MTASRATAQPAWVKLIIDHNPFYLLSAICMVLGCYVLNVALYDKGGNVPKLLILLAVINLYEAALIGLGLTLIRRGGEVLRDGLMLLAVEALFLADVGYISGVISSVNAVSGWYTNLALLALAAIKVAVVVRSLQLPWRLFTFVMLQLSVLLLLPTVYKQIANAHRGFLQELTGYAGWWIAALLAAAGTALLWPAKNAKPADSNNSKLVVSIAYVVLPYASVLVHTYGAAWVYDLHFTWAHLSPVLLGFAVALGACSRWMPHRSITRAQIAFMVLAILFSLNPRGGLAFDLAGLDITPFRLTLLGVVLVNLYIYWQLRLLTYAIAAGACFLMACMGSSFSTAWNNLARLFEGTGGFFSRLIPKTPIQWGITAIVASFVLLGLGALISLRRKPDAPPSPPPPTETPEPTELIEA